ncbi:phosphotransferase enzyme family protein [Bacillus cytotoxicus]|uniref:phosphotransferase enzyme family protein n=1 Tax=Bacillus cytotoxicus TaxID=580165 RepID=UPI0008642EBE|nr:phosphotransferase [Bacillus cytotoxicus]AWC27524.1 aminoglycoside phosphotransferase [Bacillus cytotoxicus]AWC41101.1 aminoglycoside phosphotransferase [Bacillus cytotoxicus]AWC49032.1 aminoglycoside phosphotransferase [Bacillus cytotoxicus]AWC51590.1 aminoglycoside phosphotransferase [Bacillus cytotoxicus]AWC55719.1 aminoglycoside phosphotransferase [Bacillus cytotoxicus]
MEITVEQVFNDTILEEAASLFHVKVEKKPLGDFENYIFHAEDEKKGSYVLRLTHSSHRSEVQVQAELEFLQYLKEHGAHIAGPHNSKTRKLVEGIQATDGTTFYASLFSYAQGERIKDDASIHWGDDLFQAWGKAIGQIHRLTMDYPKTRHRTTWEVDERAIIEDLEDEPLKQIANTLINHIKKLPIEKKSFGLIHGDIHQGNFHYDGTKLTIFDFDDATYNYFIHDIAMVLYYSAMVINGAMEEKTAFARHQLKVLRSGYELEHQLEERWYESLSLFLRLRDIGLYGTIQKKFKGKEMPEYFHTLSDSLYKRIMKEQPIVNI